MVLLGSLLFVVACFSKFASLRTIIPRRVLLGVSYYSSPEISGDGSMVSFLAEKNNTMNIFIKRLPDGPIEQVTYDVGQDISTHSWANRNRTILYWHDHSGDENWRLYSYDVIDGTTKALVHIDGVRADLTCNSPLVEDRIIVGINRRNKQYSDAYIIDLLTGDMTLVLQNDFYSELYCDLQLNLRIGTNETTDGGKNFYLLSVDPESGTHHAVFYKHFNVDDTVGSIFLNFNVNGNVSYWLNNQGRDLAALVSEDLTTGQQQVLHSSKKVEIDNVVSMQITGQPAIVFEWHSKPDAYALLPELEPALRRLNEFVGNQTGFIIQSTSHDLTRWIIDVFSDQQPSAFYLYDLANDQQPFTLLYRVLEDVPRYDRGVTKVFSLTTRDGLTQPCFFTFPPGSLTDDGSTVEPLPTVVYVHQGPWSHETWCFDPSAQLLASRGYLMISCNFRGSTGYGKRYLAAGNGEWGRKMQHDLLDATEWAIAHNLTLRDRVAIMGHSYGGYAALAALAFTPDFFACAIDMFGPSNLITAISSIPAYYKPLYYSTTYRMGGSPDTEDGRRFLQSRSPLFFADQMKKPLFIAQGSNDPRVKQQESDQIVNALRSQNMTVMYLLFPDEGHGFTRGANVLALWALREQFLQQCLGGAAEPLGSDLEGSSVRVKVQHGYDHLNLKLCTYTISPN